MKPRAWALAALMFLVVGFVSGCVIGWSAKVLTSGISSAVVLQTLALLVTVGLAIWTYNKTKEKEIASRLFPEKAKIYEKLLDAVKFSMKAAGSKSDGQEGEVHVDPELVERLRELQYSAIIWGDQEFIDVLSQFTGESEDPSHVFKKVADMYKQMRKELGHKDRPSIGWDALALMIKADERAVIRDAQKRWERPRTSTGT